MKALGRYPLVKFAPCHDDDDVGDVVAVVLFPILSSLRLFLLLPC